MRAIVRLLLVVAIGAPLETWAQSLPVAAGYGTRVLITKVKGASIRGTLVEVRADSLVLRTQQEPRAAVSRDNVRSVKRSTGRSAGRGAVQGFKGAAGAVWVVCSVVIGIGAAVESGPEGLFIGPAFCVPGAAMFGLFGALFGGMVGADVWVPTTLVEFAPP